MVRLPSRLAENAAARHLEHEQVVRLHRKAVARAERLDASRGRRPGTFLDATRLTLCFKLGDHEQDLGRLGKQMSE
ncbi:hypothetical protein [Halochromatium salexigens]|uniref:Uncharacterized protein n=1 Tax=Halochromatium salexigens TaxID=49447 RepID=A0AAJ0UCS0_HALSE|nr:hypothetical protein [Halochromatium salexigens]MBK5929061.1 hypothetical protein [Halochromatium salexigens]MBK5929065.1 hypothetical protein [Halochromatium salexigens]